MKVFLRSSSLTFSKKFSMVSFDIPAISESFIVDSSTTFVYFSFSPTFIWFYNITNEISFSSSSSFFLRERRNLFLCFSFLFKSSKIAANIVCVIGPYLLPRRYIFLLLFLRLCSFIAKLCLLILLIFFLFVLLLRAAFHGGRFFFFLNHQYSV